MVRRLRSVRQIDHRHLVPYGGEMNITLVRRLQVSRIFDPTLSQHLADVVREAI